MFVCFANSINISLDEMILYYENDYYDNSDGVGSHLYHRPFISYTHVTFEHNNEN